ncbi:hypothetical protein C8R47DRAFT_1224854 [Mycena vitilis]|nr:hypothetical protein C8R47DRAFT_1224854 [Mycena vitilis]
MEYLEGRTLRSCLDTFSDEDLRDVAAQLRTVLECIRRLRQPRGHTFIGPPTHDPLAGIPTGPGRSPAFNDSLPLQTGLRVIPTVTSSSAALPDTADICFTHIDLHDANIIVSPTASKGSCMADPAKCWHR